MLLLNICDDIVGRFRTGREWVRVGAHIGANPEFVGALIQELVDKYNSQEGYFLENIAYFHAEYKK